MPALTKILEVLSNSLEWFIFKLTQQARQPDWEIFLHRHQSGLVPHRYPLVIQAHICQTWPVSRSQRASGTQGQLLPKPHLQNIPVSWRQETLILAFRWQKSCGSELDWRTIIEGVSVHFPFNRCSKPTEQSSGSALVNNSCINIPLHSLSWLLWI